MTEGPRVNFIMCKALFEIYTWILCLSYLHILLFILYQNCNVLATKNLFFNAKQPVIILRVSLFVVTPADVTSWKNGCQNFSYVYRSRKH